MDYYQVLRVARDAPENEIKAAFRKIALKYHPDRLPIKSYLATELSSSCAHVLPAGF